MEFFNKKQDVIDIQLTQFGKNLLSRGLFKPVFYQMFDDGIIYDYSSHGAVESQNSVEDRIKETQFIRSNNNIFGVENSFMQQSLLISRGERETFLELTTRQSPIVREKILKSPLSQMDQSSQNLPAFKMSFIEAKAEKETVEFIVSDGYDIKIPQISMNPEYTIEVNDREVLDNFDVEPLYDSETFFDLTEEEMIFFNKRKVSIRPENILINIEELGCPYTAENFEIEIYEIREDDGTKREIRMEDNAEIFELFDIIVDESVKGYGDYSGNRKGIFIN